MIASCVVVELKSMFWTDAKAFLLCLVTILAAMKWTLLVK